MKALVGILCAAVLGCSSGDGEGGDGTSPSTNSCGDAPTDTFSAGMARTGEGAGVQVKILDAMPAPPVAYDNVWHLEITDPDGNPLEDAMVEIDTFMPKHKHGSSKPSIVVNEGGGKYTLDPLAIPMVGLWEITVKVRTDSLNDAVLFTFCAE